MTPTPKHIEEAQRLAFGLLSHAAFQQLRTHNAALLAVARAAIACKDSYWKSDGQHLERWQHFMDAISALESLGIKV